MLQVLSPTNVSHLPSVNDLEQSSTTLLYEIGQQFSGSSSIQAEAVAKTSMLVDKYPFPTFVNALFGRLAELYVADHTNDFVRLQILKAGEQSHRHLNKLSGVNLLFDKIFQVTYNTDDIARAITLRLLGVMCSVIPPAKADIVRHKIIACLDSKSDEELEAALFAATKFSNSSIQFSYDVFDKLAKKFTSINTDFATRERLANCIVGLEYDNGLFEIVLEMVDKSLDVLVDRDSSILLLKSLCGIAVSNFVFVPEVSFVLSKALEKFTVVEEQIVILKCLLRLTMHAHLWKEEVLPKLCAFASKSSVGAVKAGCYHVFLNIFESKSNFMVIPPQIRELALASLRNGSFLSIYGSLTLIYSGISASELILSPNLRLDLMLHFQYCISKLTEFRCYETHKYLVAKLLKSLESACKLKIFDIAEFSELLLPLIFDFCVHRKQFDLASAILSTLINALSTFSLFKQHPVSSLIKLKDVISLPARFASRAIKFMLLCCSPTSNDDIVLASQLISLNAMSAWRLYRLSIYGIRIGKLRFSAEIICHLLTVYSDQLSLSPCRFLELLQVLTNCYMDLLAVKFSLSNVSACMTALRSVHAKFAEVDFLCRSLMVHKSSVHHNSTQNLVTNFRSAWIRISSKLLNVASDFISKVCRLNLLMTKSSAGDKYLRVMFNETNTEIGAIADDLSSLRSTLIDGDPVTLEELQLSYRALVSVQQIISIIAADGTASPAQSADKVRTVVEQLSYGFNDSHTSNLKSVVDALSNFSGSGIGVLLESCGSIVIDACRYFAKLPPMFFSVSQHTVVKLSISPQPQQIGEPIIMLLDTSFILKVEGVIEQKASCPKIPLRHTVKFVHIKATFTTKAAEASIDSSKQLNAASLETTEPVVNDYFSTEFSFYPETVDIFSIRVSVEAIDESGMRWLVSSGSSDQMGSAPQILLKSVTQLIRTPSASSSGTNMARAANKISH